MMTFYTEKYKTMIKEVEDLINVNILLETGKLLPLTHTKIGLISK